MRTFRRLIPVPQHQVAWNLYGDFSGYFPRYNIASSQDVPVIVRNEKRNELRPMRWGLVPAWAQDRSIGQRMINARAETLLDKPSFKISLRHGAA